MALASSSRPSRALLCLGLATGLAACSGGGGGGGGIPSPTQVFPKFSEAAKPGSIEASGFGREATLGAVPAAQGLGRTMSDFSGLGQVEISVSRDAEDNPTRMSLSTPTFRQEWSADAPDTLLGGRNAIYAGFEGSSMLLAAKPDAHGFEYQTFGVWLAQDSGSSARLGSGSFGAATPATNLAAAGGASYSGVLVGLYADADFEPSVVTAQAHVSADFASRTLSFHTTESRIVEGEASTRAPRFDIPAVALRPTAGDARTFSGAGRMGGNTNALTGRVDARFYGPRAEEVGGAVSMRGQGVETFVGGFGAKKD